MEIEKAINEGNHHEAFKTALDNKSVVSAPGEDAEQQVEHMGGTAGLWPGMTKNLESAFGGAILQNIESCTTTDAQQQILKKADTAEQRIL